MLKKILSASLAFMMMSAMLVGCEGEKNEANKDGAVPSKAPVPSEAPAPSEKEAVNDTEAPSGEVSYVNASGEAFPITLLSSGRDVTGGAFDARYAGVNNAFAAVMAGAAKQEGSFVCSPLSLEIALQVLSNGGDEETSRILLESICPGMTREEANMSAAKLIAMLTESEGVNISSAVMVNKYMRLCEDFANNAADSFKASVGALDFSDPKAALEEINGWVEKNTDGMIKQLLDNIEPDTAVVILNALTFKLDWEKPFTALRELSDFKGEKGLEKVGMIQTSGEFEYGEFAEGQVVLIPYKGGEYAMAVMLPEYDADPADTLAALIGRLGECDTAKVFLKMPKI